MKIGAREIKDGDSFIDFKLGQRDFKSGHRLQIGARAISNRGRDYKSVQNMLCSKYLTKDVLDTFNPTYLMRCRDWTPVQCCPQDNFYFLYQDSIQNGKWDVVNIGTAWDDIIYHA